MAKPRMRDIEPQIIELYSKDCSVRQVAEKLGISGCKVSTTIHRAGIVRTSQEGLRLAYKQGRLRIGMRSWTQDTPLKISNTLKEGYASGRIVYTQHCLGKHQSGECKNKKKQAMLKLWADPEFSQRLIEADRAYWNSPEGKTQRQKQLHTAPNKSEQFLINFFKVHCLPFKYVGDGQVILGRLCPDFINTNGKKQLIECFSDYWHPIFDVARRTERFREYGFSLLVIWEDELEDTSRLLEKVQRFTRRRK